MYRQFAWDRYLKYEEMTQFMKSIAVDHGDLCNMYSIGKTYENRDIWCMEVTNRKTGPAGDKPAVYVDGNTHAGEVTGSMIALYTIWYLVCGEDEKAKAVLDDVTFYVVPRISADGAELYLNEPYIPRSSIRPWPDQEEGDGLYAFDVDGDGIIAQMRIEDENGAWRASKKDPRVMVRRKPSEMGGKYYSLLGEGLVRNFNGIEVKSAPSVWGLDVNRNYAAYWQQQHVQPGSGPYPFSEPESRAVAEFFETHKNIAVAQSYHTFSGAILRPPASKGDREISPKDLKALKELGEVGTEITGYPCLGVYDEFQLSQDLPKRPLWGVALEWMYEHGGVLAYSTEVWDMPNRAIGRLDTYKTLMDWTEDEGILMQKWNDENLNGEGFIDWRPFEHPQLGLVEIGGWKHKFVIQNPPPKFLKQECEKNSAHCVELALTLPKVRITQTGCESASEDVHVVWVAVRNMGYLPTNVTDQAVKNKTAGEVKVSIELSQGCELAGCEKEITLPHIEGRFALGRAFSAGQMNKHLCRWVVKGPKGARTLVKVQAPRGGADTKVIVL